MPPRLQPTAKSAPPAPVPSSSRFAPTCSTGAVRATPQTPGVFAAVRTPAGQTPTTPLPGALTARVGGRAPLTPGLGRTPIAAGVQERRPTQQLVTQHAEDSFGKELGSAPGPAPPKKPPPLRHVFEAYFSNESLQQDRYLLGLIGESLEGWIDIDTLLGLKRVKALRARREDVFQALRSSWLETYVDPDTGAAMLRRPPSHGPLPRFQARPVPKARGAAPAPLAEDEGIVAADVSTQQRWTAVKRAAPAVAAQVPKKPKVDPQQALRGTNRTGRLIGVVASFNLRLGMGKITCGEIGRDVLVDVVDLSGFDVGDGVTFLLETDAALGTPKAKELKMAGAEDGLEDDDEDEEGAPAPQQPSRPAARPAQKAPQAKQGRPAAAQPAVKVRRAPSAPPMPAAAEPEQAAAVQLKPGTRASGIIQAICPETGVGSVHCAGLGGLIEISAESLAGFEDGDSVCFAVSETGEAIEVEAA